MAANFGPSSVLVRFLFALILVFASFNPSGYSFFHWAKDILPGVDPVLALAAIVLLIGWVVFLRATLRSLGVIGIALTAALFGCLLWMVIDFGIVAADNINTVLYIVLVLLSAILAIGMSWSHIRRRMSGQTDVDDVDES